MAGITLSVFHIGPLTPTELNFVRLRHFWETDTISLAIHHAPFCSRINTQVCESNIGGLYHVFMCKCACLYIWVFTYWYIIIHISWQYTEHNRIWTHWSCYSAVQHNTALHALPLPVCSDPVLHWQITFCTTSLTSLKAHPPHHNPLVPHIYAWMNLVSIGSDNGLSPVRCIAIILTNAGILFIDPLGKKLSEIFIEIDAFSFNKIRSKMSSGK